MKDFESRIAKSRQRCEAEAAAIKEVVAPPATDLFLTETGLPEIAGPDLSRDKLAAALLYHGGLVVRNLYSPEQLALLQDSAVRDEHANREDNAPFGCTTDTLVDLLSVYEACGLLEVVRAYLDDQPMLFAERTKLRHHRSKVDGYAAIPWHQDVNFFGRKSYAVNCWAAITSCGEANPGLSLVPVRNEEAHGWDDKDGLAPLTYGRGLSELELEGICQGRAIVSPVLNPGDALLFDEMTMHQTALRRWSQDSQIVTISWFFRASGFPEWGTPLAV